MNETLNSILNNKTKKSSPDKVYLNYLLNKGDLVEIAKYLVSHGFTPIPIRISNEGLQPLVKLSEFKLEGSLQEKLIQITKVFSTTRPNGIAIKCGKASNIIVIDVDDPEKFNNFYLLKKLKEEAGYVVRTKDEGHYHFGFLYDEELKNANLVEAGFEIKTDGSLATFYTTVADAWYTVVKFEELKPLPEELKEKILSLLEKPKNLTPQETQTPKNIDPQKIIEIASEAYKEGQRQYWTMYMAGFLRKLGFSFEETKEALVEFLKSRGDEEIQMRIASIEHTYQEPLENIKGLSGLEELGLSEEAVLKLYSLTKEELQEENQYLALYDILTSKAKEPSWLIPNLLPEGFTLLGGKPKIGKSWLALQIALTCMHLGKRVVYFALEDTIGRLQKRLKLLGVTDPETLKDQPIFFSFKLPRIGKGAIKEIRACIEKFKPDLIIIDPWAKIKPQIRGKDIFLEEYNVLDVFKQFQNEGVSILLIHHARKTQSEDPVDEILGSTGQTAVVDNILVLKRIGTSKTAVLHLKPRDFEMTELGLRFENGWKLEGKAEEMMLGEGQKEVLEAIKTLEEMGEKATYKAIVELTGKSYGNVRFLVHMLVKKGLIRKNPNGTFSFCKNKNENITNTTNTTNTTNILTPLTTPPHPSFVSGVSTPTNKVLTLLSQKNSGLEEFVSGVSGVSDVSNFSIQSTYSDPPFWRVRVKNTFCKCGCNEWKIKVNPYEHTGSLVFAECLNCNFERTIDLRDFEILEEPQNDDIPF